MNEGTSGTETTRGGIGRRTGPGAKLALAVAGVLCAFVLAETALRLTYAFDRRRGGTLQQQLERARTRTLGDQRGEFDMGTLVRPSEFPDIVYELKPNLAGTFRGRSVRTNAHGMRGREIPVQKPPGTFRIAGLGDSVMFGWGVGQEEDFLAVLETRLNEMPGPHPRFETLNFAVPGYNTAIEAAVFEHRALPFHPDLVVLSFVDNDLGVPFFMQKPKPLLTLSRSYVADFVRARLGVAGADEAGNLVGFELKDVEAEEQRLVLDQYRYMLGEEGFRTALTRLGTLAREHRIPVLVIWGQAGGTQRRLLEVVCAEQGFHGFDLKPYSDAWVKRQGIQDTKEARRRAMWVGGGDRHPNARAHTIFVEAILDNLGKMGIVPPAAGAAAEAAPRPGPANPR